MEATLDFKTWFDTFPRWDEVGWFSIIAVGGYWEIMGAIYSDRTTFTQLVRSAIPVTSPWYASWGWWVRFIIICVLFWHFCTAKANFKQ